jgi:hypothetical protein
MVIHPSLTEGFQLVHSILSKICMLVGGHMSVILEASLTVNQPFKCITYG